MTSFSGLIHTSKAYLIKYSPVAVGTLGGLTGMACIGRAILSNERAASSAVSYLGERVVKVAMNAAWEHLYIAAVALCCFARYLQVSICSKKACYKHAHSLISNWSDQDADYRQKALDIYLKILGTSFRLNESNQLETLIEPAAQKGLTGVLDQIYNHFPKDFEFTDCRGQTFLDAFARLDNKKALKWLILKLPEMQKLNECIGSRRYIDKTTILEGVQALLRGLFESWKDEDTESQLQELKCYLSLLGESGNGFLARYRCINIAAHKGLTQALDLFYKHYPNDFKRAPDADKTFSDDLAEMGCEKALEWMLSKEVEGQELNDAKKKEQVCISALNSIENIIITWKDDEKKQRLKALSNYLKIALRFDDNKKLFNEYFFAHIAAANGRTEVLKWMLDHSDFGPRYLKNVDSEKATIAHYAALNGHIGVLKMLKGSEHFGTAFLKLTDDSGETISHWAAEYEGQLAESGDLAEDHVLNWLYNDKDFGADFIKIPGKSGQTAAHRAARRGNGSVIKWMLNTNNIEGDFLKLTDNSGETIAHWAATFGQVEILKALHRQFGAAFTKLTDEDGKTVAHEAAWYGQVNVLEWILQKDDLGESFLKKTDNSSETIAHWAAESKGDFDEHIEGAAEKLKDTVGPTLSWIDEILGREFLEQKDDENRTFAHSAAARGSHFGLNWIRDHLGIKFIQQVGDDGFSTAHAAAKEGNTQMLEWMFNQEGLGSEFVEKCDNNNHSIQFYGKEQEGVQGWIYSGNHCQLEEPESFD